MSITVRIPTPLRGITRNQDAVTAEAADIETLIANLEESYAGIAARLVDEKGELRRFVNVFVNGEDVRFLQGLQTALQAGDEVSIVPAVAGGGVAGERS